MHIAHLSTGPAAKSETIDVIIPKIAVNDMEPLLEAIEINPADFEMLELIIRDRSTTPIASIWGINVRPSIKVKRGQHRLVYY